MKRVLLWVLLLVLAGVGISLVVIHRQREALALDLANDLLAGTGFTVSSLSMDSLTPSELALSKLELTGSDGTSYEMGEVTVALSLPGTEVGEAAIGSVTVSPGTGSTGPTNINRLLGQLLALPEQIPGASVRIGELNWEGWPAITSVQWDTDVDQQTLRAVVAGYPTSLTVETRAPSEYRLRFAAVVAETDSQEAPGVPDSRAPTVDVEAELRGQASGYVSNGTFRADLADLAAYIQAFEEVPASLASIRGWVEAPFDLELPDSDTLTVNGIVKPRFEEVLATLMTDQGAIDITAGMSVIANIGVQYPASTWTIATERSEFSVAIPVIGEVDVAVRPLQCESAAPCAVSFDAKADSVTLNDQRIQGPSLSAKLALDAAGTGIRGQIEALSIDQVAQEGWELSGISLQGSPGVTLSTDGRLSSDSLNLILDRIQVGEDVEAQAAVNLNGLVVDLENDRVQTQFEIPAITSRLQYGDWQPTLPDFTGNLSYENGSGAIPLKATDPARNLSADMEVRLSPAAVEVAINESTLSFDVSPLSDNVGPWPWDWDVEAGTGELTGNWTQRLDGTDQVEGTFTVSLNDAALRFDDIAATQVQAERIPVALRPGGQLVVGPAPVTAALIDVGIPLTDFGVTLNWDSVADKALIEDMKADLLGGQARVEPFEFDTEALKASLRVHLKAVQLQFMADMARLEQVKVTGALSGVVPVEIAGSTISADAGQLASDEPGVIRYQSSVSGDPDSGLNVATRALSNLEYDSLTSNVTYTETGDLVLKMRLEGINPDMDPLQPVILNLSVENNIPQLLRSLQAARDIEQIIESRSGR